MDERTLPITRQWGTVRWATDATGRRPAEEIYLAMDEATRAKFLALFERFATFGKIHDPTKFHDVDHPGGKVFEFKHSHFRFLGDFAGRGVFAVAWGIADKKQRKLKPQDISKTQRILQEDTLRKGGS